jgi:hypothetical protein
MTPEDEEFARIDAEIKRRQPVPVKTCHDGKPWPVAPKPWVGLTDEEIDLFINGRGDEDDDNYVEPTGDGFGLTDADLKTLVRRAEAKLREKNAALPPMHASGLVAIKTLLERDPEAHAALVIDMIDEMLGENT